jgi:hypothetical protein
MKLNIIKHQNNHEVKNYSKVLTTVEEINRVKNSIFLYLSVKKQDIITRGLPYEELNENGFRGFVSDMFQVIMSENHIDITDGDINIQIQFSSSCETTTMAMAA